MNAIRNTKLCWNCDGEVHKHALQCPYCAVELSPPENEIEKQVSPPSYQENLVVENQPLPQPPYPISNIPGEATITDEEWKGVIEQKESFTSSDETATLKNTLLTLILLSTGSVFLLFGLILLFFSHDGILTLQWDGSYWFYYLTSSFCFIYLGNRTFKKQ